MSVRRENEKLSGALLEAINNIREHVRALCGADDYDAADEWTDCLQALLRAERSLPSNKDRP